MRAYFSVVRVKFINGLQYRVAALSGMATQFAWGGLLVLLYRALYAANPAQFPMTMYQTSSYIWLQQAFLLMFTTWNTDREIFDNITDGGIAYELARPMNLYSMWYARNIGYRLSRVLLRCLPVIIFSLCLPEPYGLMLTSPARVLGFVFSAMLSVHIVVAFNMLMYMMTIYTMSSRGVRVMFQTLTDILTGSLIPIPFMPEAWRFIVKLLPFGYTQDVPLRIYSGSIAGWEVAGQIGMQVLWLAILVTVGLWWMHRALRRVVVQGG